MSKYKTPKVEDLFEAGVHIGHQARRWHPKMEPYIFSSENKVHVFDLEQTQDLLKKASDVLYELAKKGEQIIFVGSKRQASKPVKEAAKRCGAMYVTERWLGGTITNYKMIKRNMDKLVGNMKKREEGGFQKYTKKERLLIDREIEKLEKYVGGLISLRGAPSILVIIDPRKEKTAVREAVRSNLPVIALIDSNSDPSKITYPIPGNDDAIKSISLIINSLADAVEEGYKEFAKIGEKLKKDAEDALKVVEPTPAEIKPLTIKIAAKGETLEKELIKPEESLPVVVEEIVAEEQKTDAVKDKKLAKVTKTKKS